jgi:hypothetical protein
MAGAGSTTTPRSTVVRLLGAAALAAYAWWMAGRGWGGRAT